MSSSNSPCAACKLQRRKCTQECLFAPYFPPDHPQKFANVHKVFGASNVAKLLQELDVPQREDAVNSLAYEADARLKDPVYGCVGLISILQHKLKQVKTDVDNARMELATYIGPSALLPIFHPGFLQQHTHIPPSSSSMPYGMAPMAGIPPGASQLVIREPQPQQPYIPHHNAQHQMIEPQQLAAMAVREEQEMMRTFEQHQHQHLQHHQQQQEQQQLLRFNGRYDMPGGGAVTAMAGGSGGRFSQMATSASVSSSLALGVTFDGNPYQMQQEQDAPLLLLQQPLTPSQQTSQTDVAHPTQHHHRHHQPPATTQQQQNSGSEEGGTFGPSC
ncbi:hypothetical protein Ancab_003762 [Ancistrocladus abbreviatus]